jgi:putative nucleotidyltransferase with HDIG domain
MNVIDNFFEKIASLPMMPKVIQEVLIMLEDDETDINKLVSKIDQDQVLSAKVLRLSNSSYYGRVGTVKNINDAISVTGLRNLKTLVIASGISAAFSKMPGFDLKRFWRHSLMTANIAREIAKELRKDTETTYISALMHSIGQLPIHMVFPEAGAEIDDTCHGKSVLERKNVEHTKLGIDHCVIGAELAKRWNFPEEIQSAIRYYAEPLNPNACSLAPVIYMAAHIAYDLESGEPAEKIASTLHPDVAEKLSIDLQALPEKIDAYKAFLAEAENIL